MKTAARLPALLTVVVVCGLLAGCHKAKPVEPLKPDKTAGDTTCQNYIDPMTRHAGDWEELDRKLFKLAGSGNGDPVKEAGKAAGRGDFRFTGYSRLVPGIFPAAYGVECRPDLVFSRDHSLTRTMFAASDVPPPLEGVRENPTFASAYSSFSQRYNEAILSNPRYPYRDICRPIASPPAFGIPDRAPTAQDYGYRDLKITDTPIDLGEAARRGTLASLDRLAKATKGKINRADLFGMTPLAWAIVYNRREHARFLLRSGASPAGAACQDISNATSPMQFARAMRWKDMIQEMQTYIASNQAKRLEDTPKPISSTTRDFSRSLEQAVNRYAARMPKDSMPVIANVTVDEHGKGRRCLISQGTGVRPLDDELCSAALTSIRWQPALDEFGFPVRGKGTLRLRVVAGRD